jgi:hypothetical protein
MHCWGCGVNHRHGYFSHERVGSRDLHNIEGVATMGDMAREIPRIYAALEDHQAVMVRVEGKITRQSISIIIDP